MKSGLEFMSRHRVLGGDGAELLVTSWAEISSCRSLGMVLDFIEVVSRVGWSAGPMRVEWLREVSEVLAAFLSRITLSWVNMQLCFVAECMDE